MVSVIMTTYNGEKYIIEQLRSLRDQTVEIDEVIISDDGSTDKTILICEMFIKENKLSNWRVRVNLENKGWRKNFVETASEAVGDYIFFCDQDDIWIENKVQVMTEIMDNNSKIDVLAGRYIKFWDVAPNNIAIENKGIHPVAENNYIMYTDLPGCVYCVRTVFWKKIIEFWNGIFSHDAICWATAKLFDTAYILEMPVIYWRRHYNSTYTVTSREIKKNKNRVEWLRATMSNLECIGKIIQKYDLNDRTKEKVVCYNRFIALRIQMLTKHNPFLAFKLLKYFDLYNKKRQLFLEIFLSMRSN